MAVLYNRFLCRSVASVEVSHRFASTISHTTMATRVSTVIAAIRGALTLSDTSHTVELTVAIALVARAPTSAPDKLGTRRHGWLARSMPAISRSRPRAPVAMTRRATAGVDGVVAARGPVGSGSRSADSSSWPVS